MPTVQKAARTQALTPLPAARRTAASTAIAEGAGLAEARAGVQTAVARVGATALELGGTLFYRQETENRRLAEEARQNAIDLEVIAAETRLAKAESEQVYGEQGYLTRKGKDALPLPEESTAWYDKTAGEIETSLSTPEAKAKFARIRAQRSEQLDLTMRRHVSQEMKIYAAAEAQASVENSADLAIAKALDPTAAGIELRRGERTIVTIGKQFGKPQEQIDAELQQYRGKVHLGIVDRMLANGQTTAAQIYFDEVKAAGEIPGDAIGAVEKALKEGAVREQAQKETARIMAGPTTESAARDAAKKIADPDVQDDVLRRIEHEFAVQTRLEHDRTEATLRGVADILDKTPDISRIPPKIWSELTPAQRSSFRSYAKQIVEKGDVETNLLVYYDIRRMAMSPDQKERDKFKRMNLTDSIHFLGKTEFKELTSLQAAVIEGDQKKIAALSDGYLTNQQVVDTALLGAGLDATPDPAKDPAKAAFIAKFRFEVDRQVGALGKETPTNEDIQKIVDGLLTQVTTEKGTWQGFFTSAPYYDVTKRTVELLGEIPPDARKAIEEALRAKKLEVTTDAILERWRVRQAKERAQ
jgi:hypothetical protein